MCFVLRSVFRSLVSVSMPFYLHWRLLQFFCIFNRILNRSVAVQFSGLYPTPPPPPPPPPPPQIKHATTALFAGRNNFQTTHRHALRITYHARLLSKKCSFMMKVYEATKKVVGAPKLSQENLHSLKTLLSFYSLLFLCKGK